MAKTVEELYKQQLEAEKAQLTADYDAAVSNVDAQKEQNAFNTRNNIRTAKAVDKINSVNNAEYYAAAGLASGARAQADMAQANQLQSNITSMRIAQQQADADAERQKVLLGQQYQAAIQQAQADNDLKLAELLYEEAQADGMSLFNNYANRIMQTVHDPNRQSALMRDTLKSYINAGKITPAQAAEWWSSYFNNQKEF